MKKIWLISMLFTLSILLKAQAPKFSNDFLNIGVGAKGMALSGAVTANSMNISAAYWNPAGLTDIPANFQVGLQHAEWFSGIGSYDYLGFGKKMDSGGKSYGAISLIRMAIDQIPNTLRLRGPDGSIDYSRIEEFSVADYAFLVSYGRKLNNTNWSVGTTAKIIHRSFGTFAKAWGFGFDVGILYEAKKWKMSLMGRDITTTFNAYKFKFNDEEKVVLQQTGNSIPVSSVEYTLPKLIAGFNYHFDVSTKIIIQPEIDIEFSTNGIKSGLIATNNFNMDPRIGVELDYLKKVFLRIGAGNFQRILKEDGSGNRTLSFYPTAGLGIKFNKINIDYAITNIGNAGVGLYSHYFSASLDF